MRGLFWLGVVFVVLGIASLVVPIPHSERSGVKVGGASIGIETKHEEKVSPIISAVLIAAGAGMMIAGKKAVSAINSLSGKIQRRSSGPPFSCSVG